MYQGAICLVPTAKSVQTLDHDSANASILTHSTIMTIRHLLRGQIGLRDRRISSLAGLRILSALRQCFNPRCLDAHGHPRRSGRRIGLTGVKILGRKTQLRWALCGPCPENAISCRC